MPFTSTALLAWLQAAAPKRPYWVAYSGGLDSQVLLHALSVSREGLPAGLGAVHVDHGLHPDSQHWAARCQSRCLAWEVPFHALRVDAEPAPGESPEAAARRARYAALSDWLAPGACLLTAHHQDDQAETLLLQLLRGSGPRGLAAMPARAPLGRGWLVRPLLGFTREELRRYAGAHGLDWIDDPSNADPAYERNFLRTEVMPPLSRRWPGLPRVLARAARHQSEAAHLLDALGRIDLQQLAEGRTLSLPALLELDAERQRNVLRFWLRELRLPVPSAAVMERVLDDVLGAGTDARPRVHWHGAELRRYRQRLFASPPLPAHDVTQTWTWRPQQPLRLATAGGVLSAVAVQGAGVAAALGTRTLQIGFRCGGEVIRRPGHRHHQTLKKLFQARGIPPWERDRVPLVYHGNDLIAVAGLWVCAGFEAPPGAPGIRFVWSRLEDLPPA
jgi:tRNA(Ile)-lysidine synthase